MFVSQEPVPVCVDPEGTAPGMRNIIYIRPRMGYGVQQAVMDAMVHVELATGTAAADTTIHLGAHNVALLIHNIVRWDGPAFAGVACTAAAIERLDPQEPLVDAVLSEINRRNARPGSADPNAVAPSTSAGSPASNGSPANVLEGQLAPSAPGISILNAPNATTGRPRSSRISIPSSLTS